MYYLITLEHFGKNVTYRKDKIEATSVAPILKKRNLNLSVGNRNLSNNGKLQLDPKKSYWYIPIDKDEPIYLKNEGGGGDGGDFECFCEDGGGGNCYPVSEEAGYNCLDFCDDCDMRYCPPMRIAPIIRKINGTLIEAKEVIIVSDRSFANTRSSSEKEFFGGTTKIKIVGDENQMFVSRSNVLLSNESNSRIVNLTAIHPTSNYLPLINEKSYWFIPFDLNLPPCRAGGKVGNPSCESDTKKPCEGTCSLEEDTGGCLECKCSSTGDCDMKMGIYPPGTGGILIETANLSIE
jgi:hypothetical protein